MKKLEADKRVKWKGGKPRNEGKARQRIQGGKLRDKTEKTGDRQEIGWREM